GLSDDGRAVVRVAAVLQTPVEVPLLAATSLLPADRLSQGLEEALRSGLLVPHGGGVGFRHLLATHAVYGDMPEPLRRILHERAADALAAAEPVPLGQLAHHLRRAGRLAEWVDVAEREADRAVEVGHTRRRPGCWGGGCASRRSARPAGGGTPPSRGRRRWAR